MTKAGAADVTKIDYQLYSMSTCVSQWMYQTVHEALNKGVATTEILVFLNEYQYS